MKKLKCGVIGVGYLGRFHAQKYKSLEGIELVAVSDINEKSAKSVAKENDCKFFTDYKEMLSEVDIVSIVTDTSLHYEITKYCLEKNKHVLLEKPITNTVEQAEKLIEIAKKNSLKLQIGHLERYNPPALEATSLIDNPQMIYVQRMAPFKVRATDVSVVLDLMIHDIELVQYWLQSKVKKITASGMSVLSKYVDIANATLEFENGCVANLISSRISDKQERKAKIFQNKKYFVIDFGNSCLTTSTGSMENQEISFTKKIFDKSDAILDEIKDFISSIHNDHNPTVDGTMAKNALEVAIEIENLIAKRTKEFF
jgi:predicted dehydrogenase